MFSNNLQTFFLQHSVIILTCSHPLVVSSRNIIVIRRYFEKCLFVFICHMLEGNGKCLVTNILWEVMRVMMYNEIIIIFGNSPFKVLL